MAYSLCLIFYSLLGNVDYPWSSSSSLSFVIDPTALVSTQYGTAVRILHGNGTRTFVNRFGASTTTSLTVAQNGSALLYINSSTAFDSDGLVLDLATAVQLPGNDPHTLYPTLTIHNTSTGVAECGSSAIDPAGEAFLSNVPGFVNHSIGASNLNALAVQYGTCAAPITFTNGLRTPTQPTTFNGGVHVHYNYTLGDGVTYTVQAALTLTTTSAFATTKDQLGNPYQSVSALSGVRTYTYLPTGTAVRSQVTFQVTATDQRFYPYALLSSAPGVYSENTTPFLDASGLKFSVAPSVPANGVAPGTGAQYSSISVFFTNGVLTESICTSPPSVPLQRQVYGFS